MIYFLRMTLTDAIRPPHAEPCELPTPLEQDHDGAIAALFQTLQPAWESTPNDAPSTEEPEA